MTIEASEHAVERRLFDAKYAQLAELLDGLPPEALVWKPFAHSPWQGPIGHGQLTRQLWALRHDPARPA